MKRVLLILLVLAAPYVMAQEVVISGKFGGAASWFSGENYEDFKSSLGDLYGQQLVKGGDLPYLDYTGGMGVEAKFNSYLGLVLEGLYSAVGQYLIFSYYGEPCWATVSQKIFQFPLLLKLSPSERIGFNFQAGLAMQYLVGSYKTNVSLIDKDVQVSTTTMVDNRFVLGLIVGCGYDIRFPVGIVSFDFRYGKNLTDAFDSGGFDINSFQAIVGFGIPFS